MEDLERRVSVASLLLHAQKRGGLKGVARIRHSEAVQLKLHAGRFEADNIIKNRKGVCEKNSVVERIDTRIVMSPYGKPLDRFSNRKKLLEA